MSYLPENLDDVEEAKPAPLGTYELQIVRCEEKETGPNSANPGKPIFHIHLAFTDLELNAPAVRHYLTLPYEGDENGAFKLLMLKRFLALFNVPYSSDTSTLAMNMIGQTAMVDVSLGDPREEGGDIFNEIRVPKIRGEVAGGHGKAPGRRRA